MSNYNSCFEQLNYQGGKLVFNQCNQSIQAHAKRNANAFDLNSLVELSKACYNAYEYRLREFNVRMTKAGKSEYEIINRALIGLSLEFDPLNFSFSISKDPSLHFLVRFPRGISVFVETFLDLEDGHDTYLQIYNKKKSVLKINRSFDNCLFELREYLTNTLTHNQNYFAGYSY